MFWFQYQHCTNMHRNILGCVVKIVTFRNNPNISWKEIGLNLDNKKVYARALKEDTKISSNSEEYNIGINSITTWKQ